MEYSLNNIQFYEYNMSYLIIFQEGGIIRFQIIGDMCFQDSYSLRNAEIYSTILKHIHKFESYMILDK